MSDDALMPRMRSFKSFHEYINITIILWGSREQESLSAAQSVVEQDVEYVVVEGQEDRHAEDLVPVDGAKENHHLEGYQDTLHGQQPRVDVVAGAEEELGKEGGREEGEGEELL